MMMDRRLTVMQAPPAAQQGARAVRRRAGLAQRRPPLRARQAMTATGHEDHHDVVANRQIVDIPAEHLDDAGRDYVFNKVTNQVYELGSTFKPLTVAAAIDSGAITDLSKRYPGTPLPVSGFTIRDSHPIGVTLNAPEILIHSSNIGTARMASSEIELT